MKDSTLRIINLLNSLSDAMEDKTKTSQESISIFTKEVSLSDLKNCLIDPELDDSDMTACKFMLKEFYNYEFDLN